jgi:hypothetical protein
MLADQNAKVVPTLVPKPRSPTVTQGNLPSHESATKRYGGLSKIMPDSEICSLKIRVSVVRFRPWPPLSCFLTSYKIQAIA